MQHDTISSEYLQRKLELISTVKDCHHEKQYLNVKVSQRLISAVQNRKHCLTPENPKNSSTNKNIDISGSLMNKLALGNFVLKISNVCSEK